MNPPHHRVISNPRSGCRTAEAETAGHRDKSRVGSGTDSIHSKPISSRPSPSNTFPISLVSFFLLLALGTADIVHAQVISADKNAPKAQQPTILQTAAGTPQINIQTPTAAGVSINQYRQFDINGKGAVLNNSRTHTQTQLGGWIQGNPWLAGGEARVIVNQINSSHPSQLNGYIEVGGRRAEVVIANPAGIAVNGGGFINSAHTTLTTGQPQYREGALTGIHVHSGHIAVTGKGLDTHRSDYTHILSQTAQINAPVWGQNIRIAAGQNHITADGIRPAVQKTTAGIPDNNGNTPLFAIDTGALGGMYADKITLISTAPQAEIRHQGRLYTSAGSVTVDTQGKLHNTGQISGHNVSIQAESLSGEGGLSAGSRLDIALQNDFQTERDLIAGNELSIRSRGRLRNTFILQADRHVRLQALHIDNTAQGSIQSGGATDIAAQHTLSNRGLIDGQHTRIRAGQVQNFGTGRIYGGDIAIAAADLDNQNENGTGASIAARDKMNLGIHQLNNRTDSLIYSGNDMAIGGALDVQGQAAGKAQSIHNTGATIEAAGKMHIGVATLHNTNGHLQTQLVETEREHIIDYEAHGRHELLREGTQQTSGWLVFNDESDHLRTPDGAKHENWHKYDYEKVTRETRVSRTSPAKITAGSDLTIDSKAVFNTDSQIIAGSGLAVQTETDGLHNKQTFGEKKVFSENGKLHSYWRKKRKGHDSTGHSVQTYTMPSETIRIPLGSFAYESHRTAAESRPLPESSMVKLPDSSLYSLRPAHPDYLVETDPRFTNYRQWLGSGYMLNSLKPDPNTLHKRLGDGYYEQRLINEQIAELTGHRRLDGYQNDEEQFKALMDNGAVAARSMNLSVGVALSAEQVAQLTSDIVWLIQQEVKLPDGSTQTVFVPQVYIHPKNIRINGKGTLLTGSNTHINASGILKNTGTIAGRNTLTVQTDTLDNNGGHIHAQKAALNAAQDINNTGGILSAEHTLQLKAGSNINIRSTTSRSQNTQGSSTYLDQTASIRLTGRTDSLLNLQAGKDINLTAGQIINQSAQGQTQLQAGRNINLDTVQTGRTHTTRFDADNHIIRSTTHQTGSSIQTQGDVTLSAGSNLNAEAAEVGSTNGTLTVSAKHDINIRAGIHTTQIDDASKHRGRSGGGNKLIMTDQVQSHNETAQSSTFDGKRVVLQAGNNADIYGSNVISDHSTRIQAGNHVHIGTTPTQSHSQTHRQTQKSGLMSAGIGFTIGSKKDTGENQSHGTEHTGSTAGSLKGDSTIIAGRQYIQTGSTVSSPEGNSHIRAQHIDINAAHSQTGSRTTQTHEQKGITVAFSSPVTDLAQQAIAAAQSIKQVGQSKNSRVNAMAAANAGWQAYQTDKSAQNTAADPQKAAAQVSISVTYGKQKNRQSTQIQTTQAQAGQIQAGGKTTLAATGAKEQSNLNILGSDVAGKAGTILIADNQIHLQSAEQSHSERSQNQSSGWNAGAAVTFGQNGWSLGVTAGGNLGKGYSNGDETTHRHTQIGDKNSQTHIQSSGDTELKGAQVTGKSIQLNAQNLRIHSVQDSANYQSRQQNAGAQVTIGYGFSAGGDYSQSKINADHQSVSQQSGIYAGDDGYRINIKNNTDLKGGLITSDQSAEAKGHNHLQTASLTHSHLHNHSRYEGESLGIGASITVSGKTLGQGEHNTPKESRLTTIAGKDSGRGTAGYGSDSDNQSSITRSGINTRNIRITDEAAHIRRTGKTAAQSKADIYTNASTDTAEQLSGSLKNVFDKDRVQNELDLQRTVSQDFSKNVQQANTEINQHLDKLKEDKEAAEKAAAEARVNGDIETAERKEKEAQLAAEKADSWQQGKVILNMIASGLATPTQSATGIVAATASPALSYKIGQEFKELASQNEDSCSLFEYLKKGNAK